MGEAGIILEKGGRLAMGGLKIDNEVRCARYQV